MESSWKMKEKFTNDFSKFSKNSIIFSLFFTYHKKFNYYCLL